MNRSILFFLRASSRLIYLPVAILLTFSVCAFADTAETTVSQEQPEAIKVETQNGSEPTVKNKNHASDKNQTTEFSSPIVPKIQSKTNTEDTEHHTEQTKQITYEANTSWWSLTLADSLSVLFTCLVAIFTGILAHTTKKMWTATKQSADAAEKSAESAERTSNAALRAERAQIWVGNFTLTNITPTASAIHGKEISFGLDFRIENQGRSPGSNVKYVIHVAVADGSLPDFYDIDSVEPKILKNHTLIRFKKIIPLPIAPHIIIGKDEVLRIHRDTWERISKFDKYLFLHGSITYDDIFGDPHESCFGYRLNYPPVGGVEKKEFLPLSYPDYWHYT